MFSQKKCFIKLANKNAVIAKIDLPSKKHLTPKLKEQMKKFRYHFSKPNHMLLTVRNS